MYVSDIKNKLQPNNCSCGRCLGSKRARKQKFADRPGLEWGGSLRPPLPSLATSTDHTRGGSGFGRFLREEPSAADSGLAMALLRSPIARLGQQGREAVQPRGFLFGGKINVRLTLRRFLGGQEWICVFFYGDIRRCSAVYPGLCESW